MLRRHVSYNTVSLSLIPNREDWRSCECKILKYVDVISEYRYGLYTDLQVESVSVMCVGGF